MTTGECTYIEGTTVGDRLCFQATVSGRSVGVAVKAETIYRLAEILKHTKHLGHAAWHLSSPEAELPCSTCSHGGA